MKQIAFLVAIVLSAVSYCQDQEKGFFLAKGGVNYNFLSKGNDGNNDLSGIIGWHAGAHYRYFPSKYFFVEGGMVIDTYGFKKGDWITEVYALKTPIGIGTSIFVDNKMVASFLLSPYAELGIYGNTYKGFYEEGKAFKLENENIRRFNYGVSLGVEVSLGDLSLGGSYDIGLSELIRDTGHKQRAFKISIMGSF